MHFFQESYPLHHESHLRPGRKFQAILPLGGGELPAIFKGNEELYQKTSLRVGLDGIRWICGTDFGGSEKRLQEDLRKGRKGIFDDAK